MADEWEGLVERLRRASADFARRLEAVRPEQWSLPTPCAEWDVRQLANHMARGNLNYELLLHGGTAATFLRMRDADALGADPVGAYARSVQECARAFAEAGALRRTLDYPLGRITGRQALAVRITDTAVHTWDLARAIGADDSLDGALVAWIERHLDAIYAGLAETPVSAATTHRFFASPTGSPPADASPQTRLLHRTGRTSPDGRAVRRR